MVAIWKDVARRRIAGLWSNLFFRSRTAIHQRVTTGVPLYSNVGRFTGRTFGTFIVNSAGTRLRLITRLIASLRGQRREEKLFKFLRERTSITVLRKRGNNIILLRNCSAKWMFCQWQLQSAFLVAKLTSSTDKCRNLLFVILCWYWSMYICAMFLFRRKYLN